jgi:hypothetical protein
MREEEHDSETVKRFPVKLHAAISAQLFAVFDAMQCKGMSRFLRVGGVELEVEGEFEVLTCFLLCRNRSSRRKYSGANRGPSLVSCPGVLPWDPRDVARGCQYFQSHFTTSWTA